MFRKNNLSSKNNASKTPSMRRLSLAACTGLLALLLSGCGRSDDTVQRYAWPLATASPEDTVTQIFSEKFSCHQNGLFDFFVSGTAADISTNRLFHIGRCRIWIY